MTMSGSKVRAEASPSLLSATPSAEVATRKTRHKDHINGKTNGRRMLPKASLIGFTGTPIELTDKNTRPHKHGYPTG